MTGTATAGPPAAVATNQHYDLDPEVFARFLDPMRKYSAGRYLRPEDDLATAQRNKLEFVAGRLALRGDERVLDIGCGWGATTLFLGGRGHDVTAVTPAPRQREHVITTAAARGLGGSVEVHLGEFEGFTAPPGSFGAAAALGSVVHMPDLPDVFAKVKRLLARGARFYVSESCFRSTAVQARFDTRPGTDFVRNSIFGNGRLRPLSELVAAAEATGFSVLAVDDLTDDYRRTIDAWAANVDTSTEEIDALVPGLAAKLRHYLDVANAGWGYTTKHYGLTLRNAR